MFMNYQFFCYRESILKIMLIFTVIVLQIKETAKLNSRQMSSFLIFWLFGMQEMSDFTGKTGKSDLFRDGHNFTLFYFFCFSRQEFLCSFGVYPGTSSCRPGWPRAHSDPPASASRVLKLKACATTARPIILFLNHMCYLRYCTKSMT